MRNILIIVCFVALGICGGFLCRGFYREAIETKLVEETRQEILELNKKGVDVKCDHLFATLTFEPSFAVVEQKEFSSLVKNRGVYLGNSIEPVAKKVAVVEEKVNKPLPEPEANKVVNVPAKPIAKKLVKPRVSKPVPKPEPKVSPELFVYLNRENQMVLEGRFPNAPVKDLLISRIEEVFTDNKVIDMITIASNVDSLPWDRPDELILNLMGLTTEGAVMFSGEGITISGKTYSHSVKDGLNDLATLVVGSSGVVTNKIRTVAPVSVTEAKPQNPVRAQRVASVFEDQAIYFRSGSSSLNSRDLEKIKVIAESIGSFDVAQKLIVGGYADQTGDPEANRSLSLERANAVRRELVKLGVSADRLIVKHFGEDTSNLNDDTMWQSRRVELSLSDQ